MFLTHTLRILLVFFLAICVVTRTQEADEILTSTIDSGVQDIILPMCRGFLEYNQTKLQDQFGHSIQVEIYRLVQSL